MGLDRFGAEAFALLKRRNYPLNRVLTLGRQHFTVHPREFASVPGLTEIAERAPDLAHDGERYAESFFRHLGVEEVVSLDASAYESCDLVHDLNRPMPTDWHARHDVVFDGGTLEHVYHFPVAIHNALNLVREGGCFVSCTPSNHYNGHGFYQFSPELFYRLLDESRGYRVVAMALAESRLGGALYAVSDPGSIGHRITFQGRGPVQLIVIARRLNSRPLSAETPVYQSDYSATWDQDTGPAVPVTAPVGGASIKRRLKSWLPASLVHRYEHHTHDRKHLALSRRGLRLARSLEDCLIA